MSTPVRAANVRKARVQSVCGLCEHLIQVHNPIGKLAGFGWCHVGCIIKRQSERRPIVIDPENT